ncbi:MAG: UDP-glucose 4-epimerase GalE [Spirochaetes bacterium GWF1_41_5]|nr:MAG: UDP-glucose 4-epimerase GalE [Spirochaetes bacterium GWF1_41_5]HBE01468.1 UDP-glucose 4-epimerase GalE [Spirochaetia bacterium]
MKVCVSGGAGYIGSHCVRELERAGHDPLVIDNLSKGHKAAVKKSPLYTGDIRDPDFLRKVFTESRPDAVIHFAADSLVGESMENPLKYYRNNVYTSLCLLESMLEFDIKYIVFSSTAATYGDPYQIPIRENDPTIPKNPYGETKLAIEKMLSWCKVYNITYTVLRYFNAAGADQNSDIGEDHSPETHLIPIVLQTALGKREKIMIYGDDYKTPDGTCIRDYIHVSDLSTAHILALQKMQADGVSNTYNLGTSSGLSVREIIKTAEKVTGKTIPYAVAPRRSGDPAELIAESSRARSELNWKPRYENVESIISSAWKWHKNNPDGYK